MSGGWEKNMEYDVVYCTGTFDHLHKGHKEYLTTGFQNGRKVVIGITSDPCLHKKNKAFPREHQKYEERYRVLQEFLQENFPGRFEIVEIKELPGPGKVKENSEKYKGHVYLRKDIQAFVNCTKTINAGRQLNRRREEAGLNLLPEIMSPSLHKDSSTDIREKLALEKFGSNHPYVIEQQGRKDASISIWDRKK